MLGAQRLPGFGEELLRPLQRPCDSGFAEDALEDGVHERPAHGTGSGGSGNRSIVRKR